MTTDFHSPGAAEKLIVPEVDHDTRQMIINAINDDRVVQSQTLHEQIGWLCTILRPKGNGMSYEKIGRLFSPAKTHATIKRHFDASQKISKLPNRPELLDRSQYRILRDELKRITKIYENPSLGDVISFINDSFNIVVSRRTATRIIKRVGFKLMQAKPVEEERFMCKLDDIFDYYGNLSKTLSEIPCGFCYNLDESGIQRYTDAKNTYLVVPVDFPDEQLTFPVYRAGKRITLLHCICTDGSYVKPLIVLPRKTVDDDVFNYINPNSCRFASQVNGFLTSELFEYWLITCFFPDLEKRRGIYQYYGPALLIMDGFKGHTKAFENIKNTFTEKNVEVLFIPPHSSDQVQPLDLLGFNLLKLKKNKSHITFQEGTSDQTKEIVRIMNAVESVSTSVLITKAWNAAGIFRKPVEKYSFNEEVLIQYHEIDIERARKIRIQNEENRNRLKSFSENLVRQNVYDTERVFPNPSRFRTPSSQDKVRMEFISKNKD